MRPNGPECTPPCRRAQPSPRTASTPKRTLAQPTVNTDAAGEYLALSSLSLSIYFSVNVLTEEEFDYQFDRRPFDAKYFGIQKIYVPVGD
ncbi:hypothetical protein B5X24_HaOG210533 [Helicoverpa armigera]|uniref:Uncharacterized protein n=1 Tax=Helicoverpa armigera TaxID=29058 RepID=A0A2W1BJC7_HELAM|nr:hypothetical protein B5X24_HaOG210533 [Helicoverpa armigera]